MRMKNRMHWNCNDTWSNEKLTITKLKFIKILQSHSLITETVRPFKSLLVLKKKSSFLFCLLINFNSGNFLLHIWQIPLKPSDKKTLFASNSRIAEQIADSNFIFKGCIIFGSKVFSVSQNAKARFSKLQLF
jgi:hypothetical protein